MTVVLLQICICKEIYLWRNLTFSRDSSTSPNDSFFCHKVKLNSILVKSDCGRSMVRVSTCSESNTFHQKFNEEIPDNENIGETTTLTLHLEKIMPMTAIMARDYFEGNFELYSNLSVFHTAHILTDSRRQNTPWDHALLNRECKIGMDSTIWTGNRTSC